MRAFFLEDADVNALEVKIDDYQHHHYVHVLRGKLDDSVLVVNGKGLKLCGKVTNISKKTPYIADLKPGGKFVAKDLYEIGGVPILIKALKLNFWNFH